MQIFESCARPLNQNCQEWEEGLVIRFNKTVGDSGACSSLRTTAFWTISNLKPISKLIILPENNSLEGANSIVSFD
jgi:hypothetical protein